MSETGSRTCTASYMRARHSVDRDACGWTQAPSIATIDIQLPRYVDMLPVVEKCVTNIRRSCGLLDLETYHVAIINGVTGLAWIA